MSDAKARHRVIIRRQESNRISAVAVALYREYDTDRETRNEAEILKRWKA